LLDKQIHSDTACLEDRVSKSCDWSADETEEAEDLMGAFSRAEEMELKLPFGSAWDMALRKAFCIPSILEIGYRLGFYEFWLL